MVRRSAVLLAALAAIVGVAPPAAHAAAAPFKLTIHLTKTPARLTNQATPTFSLVRNVHFGVRSQTCRIDTAAWKACSLLWKPGHLKDGRHTAQARLVMNDHRVATAGYTWTIDTAAPAPPRLAGLVAGWSNGPETVTATASDTTGGSGVDHLEYRIANGAGSTYTAAQTGRQVTISGEGVTQVRFRAVDRAGNVSGWSAAGVVQIDTTVPGVPSVSASTDSWSWSNAASQTITAQSSGSGGSPVHLEYRTTDTFAAVPAGSGQTGSQVTISREGITQVQFRAVDAAGNASAWTSPAIVALDRTAPPSPGIENPPAPGTWLTTSPFINPGDAVDPAPAGDQSSGPGQIQHRIGVVGDSGVTWGDPVDSGTFQLPGDGTYQVEVRLIDAAGNVGAWSDPAAYQLDTTAPDVPTMSGTTGANAWANDAVLVSFDQPSDHNGSGVSYFEYRTSDDQGQSWDAPGSGASGLQVSGEGITWVQVRAVDNAGHASDWSDPGIVQIDETAPTAPTTWGGTGTGTWATSAPVNVSSLMNSTDSGGSGLYSYQYRESYDGGVTWQPTVRPANGDNVSRDGVTWVEFSAVDNAGNVSNWSDPKIVQINTLAAPVVTGGHGSTPDTASQVFWSWQPVVDPVDPSFQVQYDSQLSINGGAWIDTGVAPFTNRLCGGTVIQIRVRAVGSLGVWSDWSQVTDGSTERWAC